MLFFIILKSNNVIVVLWLHYIMSCHFLSFGCCVSGAPGIFRWALMSDVVLRLGQTLGRHPLSACDLPIWWSCPECFDHSDLISALDQKDTCHQDSRRSSGSVRVQKSVCGPPGSETTLPPSTQINSQSMNHVLPLRRNEDNSTWA